MKKLILPAVLAMALPAMAAIDISWPSNPMATLNVVETPIGQDSIIVQSTLTLNQGKASYTPQSLNPATVRFSTDEHRVGEVYTSSPKDEIVMEVAEDGQASYNGTPLMDGVTQLRNQLAPYEKEFYEIQLLSKSDMDKAQALFEQWQPRYFAAINDFIAANPSTPAAPYALLFLDSDAFMKAYDALTPQARQSIVMPLVETARAGIEKQRAAEQKMQQMQSGTYAAPSFTLPDLQDKPVSLADFKGKWVVLDFWGAWCRWCIKGFPELKEAYKKYAGKLEVIGIDNRDTPERWREAVAKYELPWVSLYNDTESEQGKALLEQYAVQGFPTKVIIDPQGIIRNITVGEDPNFYTVLDELMK